MKDPFLHQAAQLASELEANAKRELRSKKRLLRKSEELNERINDYKENKHLMNGL